MSKQILISSSVDPQDIIIKIGEYSYLVQGLNAQLFLDVCYSGFIFNNYKLSDDEKQRMIANCAIALSQRNQQVTEEATCRVISMLWKCDKKTGISHFVELLAKRQWKDSDWEGYRDHITHMLIVYLTGLFILKNCPLLKRNLVSCSGLSEIEFQKYWLYTSTFHDIGYIFELSSPDKIKEDLAFIQNYLESYFSHHDKALSEELLEVGLKINSIDPKYSKEILRIIGVQFKQIVTFDDMVRSNDDLPDLWKVLNHLCSDSGIGSNGISVYFTNCLTQSPQMDNGRKPFYDHGISGAILFLFLAYSQKMIFEKLKLSLSASESKEYRALEKIGRLEILQKFSEWTTDIDAYVKMIESVSKAIALHNINKDAWKRSGTTWELDLSFFGINIRENPLAFFLIFVDVIQNWDRPGFSHIDLSEEKQFLGSDIEMDFTNKKVLFRYSYDPTQYDKTISELSKILDIKDIQTYVGKITSKKKKQLILSENQNFIKTHKEATIDKFKEDWFNNYIDLFMLPMKLSKYDKNKKDTLTINDLVNNYKQPIAILGEPGAGKSTIIKKIAIDFAEQNTLIPIYFELGLYNESNFIQNGLRFIPDDKLRIKLLEEGKFIFLFDGLNEIGLDKNLKTHAVREIEQFINDHPENKYFLTCRTAEYPPLLRRYFKEFYVLPLSYDDEKEFLKNSLGEVRGIAVFKKLSHRLRELCQNPLLLTMLSVIFLGDRMESLLLESKADLYGEFIHELFKQTEKSRIVHTHVSTREEFISYIAYKLDNRNIYFSRSSAEQWVTELYRKEYSQTGLNLIILLEEILNLPPFQASEPGTSPDIKISFMHQSFQEYYSARSLLYSFLPEKISPENIINYIIPERAQWVESIVLFMGLLDDATPYIKAIKEYSLETALVSDNQSIITLATKCIKDAKYINPNEVDDVIFRALLAFKYGKISFNFDLIYGVKGIREELRSDKFPNRLIEDVNWWIGKYARASSSRLDGRVTLEELIHYLLTHDEILIIEAFFSLRMHSQRNQAFEHLLEMIKHTEGTVREQAIITIGYLEGAAKQATEELVDIVTNKSQKETQWERAYALFALGKIGNPIAFPIMVDYMLDHENLFRDSASWALQELAKRNFQNNDLIENLKEKYIVALLAEKDDKPGRYAKGNILYSLGELNAREYSDVIIEYLQKQSDPYVLEDGFQTLGILGNPDAIPLLIKNLNNDDPIVRMMVVVSLTKLIIENPTKSINLSSYLENKINDDYEIVREKAKSSIEMLKTVIER